jgi:hypothetical protein
MKVANSNDRTLGKSPSMALDSGILAGTTYLLALLKILAN